MRQQVDTLADDCLLAIHERGISIDAFIAGLKDTKPSAYGDPRIQAFAESVLTLPPWLDWETARQGQYIFLKHYGSASLGLLYVSLIGGFAAPKITKVLDATAYMTKNRDATYRRMNETFEMVLDCMDGDDTLFVGNKGFNSVLKVRFLHSRVRLNLLGKMKRSGAVSSRSSINGHSNGGIDILNSASCPFHQSFNAHSSDVLDGIDAETEIETETVSELLKEYVSTNAATSNVGSPVVFLRDMEVRKSRESALGRSTSSGSGFLMVDPAVNDDVTLKVDVTVKVNVTSTQSQSSQGLLSGSVSKSEWDSKENGMPINQEDMMATLLSFSVNVIDTIEKRTVRGTLPIVDQEAYIHLWRYIGYLIGVHDDVNPCTGINRGCGAMESIILHLMTPNEGSGRLARHLLHSIANRSPLNWSYEMHSETCRALLGPKLSDALGLERNFVKYILSHMVLSLNTAISFCSVRLLYRGSKRIERVKKVLRYAMNKALKRPIDQGATVPVSATTEEKDKTPSFLFNGTSRLILATAAVVLYVKSRHA